MVLSDEQITKVRNSTLKAENCSNQFVSSWAVDEDKIKVRIHPLLCHSPYCKKCQDIKVQHIFPKLIDFSQRRELRFMHLTYQANEGPEKILKQFSSDWNKLVTYLRRMKFQFNFFKIIEFTKQDIIHFHVLIDCYIPKFLLENTWRKITKHSYIVFIDHVRKHSSALHECLKYITKSHAGKQDLYVAFNIRRFSFSRFTWDFERSRDLSPDTWHFERNIFSSLEEAQAYWKIWYKNQEVPEMKYKTRELIFL